MSSIKIRLHNNNNKICGLVPIQLLMMIPFFADLAQDFDDFADQQEIPIPWTFDAETIDLVRTAFRLVILYVKNRSAAIKASHCVKSLNIPSDVIPHVIKMAGFFFVEELHDYLVSKIRWNKISSLREFPQYIISEICDKYLDWTLGQSTAVLPTQYKCRRCNKMYDVKMKMWCDMSGRCEIDTIIPIQNTFKDNLQNFLYKNPNLAEYILLNMDRETIICRYKIPEKSTKRFQSATDYASLQNYYQFISKSKYSPVENYVWCDKEVVVAKQEYERISNTSRHGVDYVYVQGLDIIRRNFYEDGAHLSYLTVPASMTRSEFAEACEIAWNAVVQAENRARQSYAKKYTNTKSNAWCEGMKV